MNKILLSLLVSGVFFGGVQDASAMHPLATREVNDLHSPKKMQTNRKNQATIERLPIASRNTEGQGSTKRQAVRLLFGAGVRYVVTPDNHLNPMAYVNPRNKISHEDIIATATPGVRIVLAGQPFTDEEIVPAFVNAEVVTATAIIPTQRMSRISNLDANLFKLYMQNKLLAPYRKLDTAAKLHGVVKPCRKKKDVESDKIAKPRTRNTTHVDSAKQRVSSNTRSKTDNSESEGPVSSRLRNIQRKTPYPQ